MGMFSWLTCDTKQSIPTPAARDRKPLPVYMWWPFAGKLQSVHETLYGGYGDFDDIDYYELVARLNAGHPDMAAIREEHDGEGLRILGIWFESRYRNAGLSAPAVFPQFTERNVAPADYGTPPESCPYQGFMYPDAVLLMTLAITYEPNGVPVSGIIGALEGRAQDFLNTQWLASLNDPALSAARFIKAEATVAQKKEDD